MAPEIRVIQVPAENNGIRAEHAVLAAAAVGLLFGLVTRTSKAKAEQ